MKSLLLLLPLTLFAELYECKNAFLSVEPNRIVLVTKDGNTSLAKRSYGSFCYDFYDGDEKVYLCLTHNGNTFTWSTSDGKRTEKCTRID